MILEFLLYTIISLLANASMAHMLYISIQDGQWLDKLFKWQYRLRKWNEAGKWYVKPLGYCELCFCHMAGFIGFWFYCLFMICADMFPFSGWMWALWYMIYVPLASALSLYFITKLYNR